MKTEDNRHFFGRDVLFGYPWYPLYTSDLLGGVSDHACTADLGQLEESLIFLRATLMQGRYPERAGSFLSRTCDFDGFPAFIPLLSVCSHPSCKIFASSSSVQFLLRKENSDALDIQAKERTC